MGKFNNKITTSLSIQTLLFQEQTDLSKCYCCNDVIYGNMFRLWLSPEINNVICFSEKTKFVLCESCSNIVDIKKGIKIRNNENTNISG